MKAATTLTPLTIPLMQLEKHAPRHPQRFHKRRRNLGVLQGNAAIHIVITFPIVTLSCRTASLSLTGAVCVRVSFRRSRLRCCCIVTINVIMLLITAAAVHPSLFICAAAISRCSSPHVKPCRAVLLAPHNAAAGWRVQRHARRHMRYRARLLRTS